MLVSGHDFEIYDGSSETVFKGTLPEEGGKDAGSEHGVPSWGRSKQRSAKPKSTPN